MQVNQPTCSFEYMCVHARDLIGRILCLSLSYNYSQAFVVVSILEGIVLATNGNTFIHLYGPRYVSLPSKQTQT